MGYFYTNTKPIEPMETKKKKDHSAHQHAIREYRERKQRAREWHTNPNQKRSIPPNTLI